MPICSKYATRTLVLAIYIAWVFAAVPLRGDQTSISGEDNELPSPCATDPDYREFEHIQADAYLEDKALDFRKILNPDFQDKVVQATLNAMRARTRETRPIVRITTADTEKFAATIRKLRSPTCYENPVYFFIMTHFAQDVELARRELGLGIDAIPKFGSLPSNDINAYTYPVRHGRGAVIAINAQLFNFASTMTQLAAAGVDPTFRHDLDSDASIITNTLLNISYSDRNQALFVRSVLGLLLGKPIVKPPMDPSRDGLIAFFVGAIERFVFAHEYGHLINRDSLRPVLRPTGATGNQEHEVLARTWEEEFDADATGVQLMMQLLRGSAADNPDTAKYDVYALMAPLFFFECMEILERAQFMIEHKTMPPALTEEYKANIRACANTSDKEPKCAVEVQGSHPPAWLRRERLEATINDRLAHVANRTMAEVAKQKGKEMIFSVDTFWEDSSHRLLEQIIQSANVN
jgi:hypothetical protein